jgi:integrase
MAKARRGRGEDALFQRADGYWVARVAARDEFGRPIRRQAVRKEKADAIAALKTLRGSAKRGTVGEFLERWLTDVAKPRVDAGTLAGYRDVIERLVLPHIGEVDLNALSAQKVAALLRVLEDAGKGAPTRIKVHSVLRNALKTAEVWGLIDRNPCWAIPQPKHDPPERPTLGVEDARRALELMLSDELAGVYVVALTMGIRQGEILGMQWPDIDFERGTLRMQHSLQEYHGRLRLKGLKRRRQRRELPIPAIALETLQAARNTAKAAGRDVSRGYVFVNSVGKPIQKANFHRSSWAPLRAQLGAAGEHLHFHDLRHTLGHLQKRLGVGLEARAEQLGHASTKTTAEVYGHSVPEHLVAAAAAVDKLLRPSTSAARPKGTVSGTPPTLRQRLKRLKRRSGEGNPVISGAA